VSSDYELSEAQSRHIAATIREEIARRRMSRKQLADKAKLSISTLEKVLGGRRPFTLATTVRLEEALGVPLRKPGAPDIDLQKKDAAAPDSLGAYTHRAVAWIEAGERESAVGIELAGGRPRIGRREADVSVREWLSINQHSARDRHPRRATVATTGRRRQSA